jgi:hypothetical protein
MLAAATPLSKKILIELFRLCPGVQVLTDNLIRILEIPGEVVDDLLLCEVLSRKRGYVCVSETFRRFLTTSAQIKSVVCAKSAASVVKDGDDQVVKDLAASYRLFLGKSSAVNKCKGSTLRFKLVRTTELDDAMESAQEFLSNKSEFSSVEVDEEHFRVSELVRMYYSRVSKYNSLIRASFSVDKGHPNYRRFASVLRAAEELRVPLDKYLDAQFYFFQSWFRRCPHVFELATDRAKVRVVKYLKLTDKTPQDIGALPMPSISKEHKFRHSEQQLKTFMENYEMSEEQVLKTFAKRTDFFDREWLKSNEVYKRLKSAGEV